MVVWDKDALLASLRGKATPSVSMPAENVQFKKNLEISGPEEAEASRKGYFLANMGVIQGYEPEPGLAQSRYLDQAEEMMFRANQLNQKAVGLRAFRPVTQVGGPPPIDFDLSQISGGKVKGNPAKRPVANAGRFGKFIQAIAGKESGGSYSAVNRDSGAMGKYQIMPSNIAGPGGWDQEILGRNVTTQQFLSNPKIQEAIARGKLRQYFNKYGARGAASAWYSGDPNKWRNTSPQGGYPSINAYVLDIIRRMGS